ncbi:Oidioi.mRNA.OKI2018_I69.chr1.g925.t1.cds [Oikopleura dioica]|uniref:Oidioi.mRNA.OKI2018_I69.chr1.g925.t1.cds n=1 Tax=Oikopleura dioica TaxID=34765 RepID=A0ABN7SRL1_OIKDI|nr:Oidioi.mRNA.OKI2018_I69.chr1.g925.t1.cds [Oikopleura dioica]
MVNLLSNKSLRLLTILLSIFGIGACISHCFVFIILFSRIETFGRLWNLEAVRGEEETKLPLSILGQGLWCGGMALCTACVTFSYISARIQNNFDQFCFRGERFATNNVVFLFILTFLISLFGTLTDGYGLLTLLKSSWFSSLGGTALFSMLLIEVFCILGINIVAFICISFTSKDDFLIIQARKNAHLYDHLPRLQAGDATSSSSRSSSSRNSRTEVQYAPVSKKMTSAWGHFNSATDLYHVKALPYDSHFVDKTTSGYSSSISVESEMDKVGIENCDYYLPKAPVVRLQ